MEAQKYVGITGPVSKEEVKVILNEFDNAGFSTDSSHVPMIGFLVSAKTLQGQEVSNRRYPKLTLVPELLREAGEEIFRTVHYNTRDLATLSSQVSSLLDGTYQDGLCQGIQLNMTFPPISQIELIKNKFQNLKIIFQANNGVINIGSSEDVAKRIEEYEGLIDYVLLDPSGGRGKEFDIGKSVELAKEIRGRSPNLIVGYAGGFTGENVHMRCSDLIKRIGDSHFCIDAEGGLRDKLSDAYGEDILNHKKVRSYLQESSKVFN